MQLLNLELFDRPHQMLHSGPGSFDLDASIYRKAPAYEPAASILLAKIGPVHSSAFGHC